MDRHTTPPLQRGFLLLLLTLALGLLGWILRPFLPALLMALLLATSTHPLYQALARHWRSGWAAATTTAGVLIIVVLPLTYVLISSALRAGVAAGQAGRWLAALNPEALRAQAAAQLERLPLHEALISGLDDLVIDQLPAIARGVQGLLVHLFGALLDNIGAFSLSIAVIIFSLPFLYRDGPRLVAYLERLSPLNRRDNYLIMQRFASLAAILTWTTLAIALLQGTAMAAIAAVLGLPWFYLGLLVALASFIPVVGSLIVWAPASAYLLLNGRIGAGLFMIFWGIVVLGFLLDNVARPLFLGWLGRLHPAAGELDLDVVHHPLLSVLVIAGGLATFGVLGLFFGPLIAALAVTMLEVYEHHYAAPAEPD